MFTQNVWGSWDPRPRARKWMRWQVFTVVQGLGWAPINNDVSCIVQHFAAVRVVAPVLCVQILWIDLELYLVSFVLFVTGVEQELLPYEALTRPYKTCLCVCVCVNWQTQFRLWWFSACDQGVGGKVLCPVAWAWMWMFLAAWHWLKAWREFLLVGSSVVNPCNRWHPALWWSRVIGDILQLLARSPW